ncbi:YbfB/YjiJ family MFS transporter [Parageobacillus thermoglucosidasius]|uniref:YbfB/YjiJ family MFS transporter n=1 Tax=Parageobacillus thermoglucosidasius TaxID=1426 RepID=UPI0030C6F0FC
MIIVMGIGRFAYTPILPYMNITKSMAGYLASLNYLGYLAGTLFVSFFNLRRYESIYLKIFLVLNIFTTLLMGVVSNYTFWYLLRFFSGFSSGVVFVLVSSIVLQVLKKHNMQIFNGLFYSGVGIGIFLCSILVPFFISINGWKGSWIGLGCTSLFLSPIVFLSIRSSTENHLLQPSESSQIKNDKQHPLFIWLILSYGCEGIGYIITGTFLVDMVKEVPDLKHFAMLSWAFVGLAAAPSCIIWSWIANKYGDIKSLYAAYLLQAAGILLPLILPNFIGVLLGALLFGGTFMGITTLTVSNVQYMSSKNSSKLIGYLTAVYGLGQIIGPIAASILTKWYGNYVLAQIFAAAIIGLGLLCLIIGSRKAEKENYHDVFFNDGNDLIP